ncbi:MAG: FlxA-like family protein [Candidatus Pristimantibacillus sp.]
MNISSSVPSTNAGTGAASNDIDKQIMQLEKRKAVLIKEVFKVMAGGESPEAKQERVEALNKEIMMVDMQINFLLAKKAQIEKDKQKNESVPKVEKSPHNQIDVKS